MDTSAGITRRLREAVPVRIRPQMVIDGVGSAAASIFAVFLRYEFSFARAVGRTIMLTVAFGLTVVVAGTAVGLYRRRWKFGSFEELPHLALSLGLAGG